MSDVNKTKAQEAREFVEQHQTICACAATAIVTAIVTRKITIEESKRMIQPLLHQVRMDSLSLGIFAAFVDEKGLMDEFITTLDPIKK